MEALFQKDGRSIPGIVVRDGSIANLNVMEDPQNSLLSSYCIKKIRRGIRKEDQTVEVTICYSSPNPNLTMKCFYDQNDRRKGKFMVYDGTSPIITGSFVNDLMEGVITVRNRNGTISFDGFYRNGKREGVGTEYSAGVKSFQGNYYNDKRNGPGSVFDNSGHIVSSKFYVDGKETLSYVEGDILYVYEDNYIVAAGEFNPVSYRLEGYGVKYTPGSHSQDDKPWKAGLFSDGNLIMIDREFEGDIMIEYQEQRKVYQGGYRSNGVKKFSRFGDGIEYCDDGYVCLSHYNEFGKHGFFIKGPSLDELFKIRVEDAVIGNVNAIGCKYRRYENGDEVGDDWIDIEEQANPDPCSVCLSRTCVCIPNRKKYQSALWLSGHCYLYWVCLVILLVLVGFLVYKLQPEECSIQTMSISATQTWMGMVCNHKANGNGVMYVNHVKYYNGTVINNMYHGQGVSYYPNGNIQYEGNWSLNQFINGSHYSETSFLLYVGEFVANKYNGHGTFFYPSGCPHYIGQWLDGEIIFGDEYNLLQERVYSGSFTALSGKKNGCFYYHTNQVMFNLTWDRENQVSGNFFAFNDNYSVYAGDAISLYYVYATHRFDYELYFDEFVGFLNINLSIQEPIPLHIHDYPFLYMLEIESQNISSYSGISIVHNPLLHSITFKGKSSLHNTTQTLSLIVRDNPSLALLVFEENSMEIGDELILENLPELRMIIFGNLDNTYSPNFMNARKLTIESRWFINGYSFDLPRLETISFGSYSFYNIETIDFYYLPNLTSITFFSYSIGNRTKISYMKYYDLPLIEVIHGYDHCLDSVVNMTLAHTPVLNDFQLHGNTCFASLLCIFRCTNIMSSFHQSIQKFKSEIHPLQGVDYCEP